MKITRYVPSEATIQAELYMALRAAGFQVILEQVFSLVGSTRTGRKERIRADILVLRGEDAFAAIEVKNSVASKSTEAFAHTRQSRKHRELGLPFRYCCNLGQMPETLAWIQSIAPEKRDA